MLQARQHTEEPHRVIFRETFNSEFETRLKGGIPTDVTYSKGVLTSDASSLGILYPPIPSGTYSIRAKIKVTTTSTNQYLVSFYISGDAGSGYYYINASGNVTGSSGTTYINGQAGAGITANTWQEVVITGATFNPTRVLIALGVGGTLPLLGEMDFIEIYNYALTAEEVSNLYSG